MPVCPKCHYEYMLGKVVCADCQVPLVDNLTVAGDKELTPDDDWTVVGAVEGDLRSALARGSLDSNNIPSVMLSSRSDLTASHLGSIGGGSSFGPDRHLFLVPKEFKDEALTILQGVLGDELYPVDRNEIQ